ncbi:MAG: nucleoside 2-deoxyribosyltransferase, partial [Chloroflexi bacterium]
DDGTAWELGYAYARGKHLIGVYTDMRLTFNEQVVNLMIECALDKLVRSLDALEDYLRTYVEGR